MKSSKCENEDMAIVSVTVQDGKDDLIWGVIGSINLFIAMIGFGVTIAALTSREYIIAAVVAIAFAFFPGIICFLCFSFRKLMPYPTHDEVQYVCKHCGHIEMVKEQDASAITKKAPEQTDPNSIYF